MVRFGILNGYVEDPTKEKGCTEYAWTINKPEFWNRYFSSLKTKDGQQKYDITEIMANEINDRFAVILNPFGETYPEYSFERREVYNIIRNYIRNGGVFINTAGFPFFYAWLVGEGKRYEISEEKLLLPTKIDIKGGNFSIEQLQALIQFTGTLYYRDFGAATTADTIAHSGPIPLMPFQKEEDRGKFGDLINGLKELTEFRALRSGTPSCIPLVRAAREDFGEVYPVSALKHGRGYLLVSAMGMADEKEAGLFARAADKFCDWVSSKYI